LGIGVCAKRDLAKRDLDRCVGVILPDLDLLVARQLEQRQEEADHLAARAAFHHLLQREAAARRAPEPVHDVCLVQADGRVVVLDAVVAKSRQVDRRDDPLERLDQVQDVRILDLDRFLCISVVGRIAAVAACGPPARALMTQRIERLSRRSVALVRQQLAHQLEARVCSIEPVGWRVASVGARLSRRKRSALDLHKRRRHHQELAGKVHVDAVDLLEEREVLLGDRVDRDIADVDLRAPHEEEQQVQRTLEARQAHLVVVLQGHRRKVSGTLPRMPVAANEETRFIAEALEAEASSIRAIADRVRADSRTSEDWTRAVELLSGCTGLVVVAGMGKSGLVGAKISATMASLGQPSHVVHPAEALHGDLGRIRREDAALLLSYSGETEEVVNLALILKADGVRRIGISCRGDTSLAKACDAHLALGDIVEACPLRLAPTASTAAMLAVGDALALAVSRRREFTHDDFRRRHPGGLLGAGLKGITEVLRFRVGDNLPVVADTCSVQQALAAAGEGRRAGALMLVDGQGRLSGIFTDGDLRRNLNSHGVGVLQQPIASVMTRHPCTLPSDALVRDAVRLVRERRLDEIPVVDTNGHPIGLVDVQDLITMRVTEA
jgi:arabinose-5-phosphate isomerase